MVVLQITGGGQAEARGESEQITRSFDLARGVVPGGGPTAIPRLPRWGPPRCRPTGSSAATIPRPRTRRWRPCKAVLRSGFGRRGGRVAAAEFTFSESLATWELRKHIDVMYLFTYSCGKRNLLMTNNINCDQVCAVDTTGHKAIEIGGKNDLPAIFLPRKLQSQNIGV